MSEQWKSGPWDEKWKYVSDLGAGGQGTTFRVESKEDGSQGALKILRYPGRKSRDRMYQEAFSLRLLRHKQIARLLDTNAEEFEGNAELYLVTEYVDGGTLQESVSKRRPTLEEAFKLTLSLCEALEHAHGHRVYHRDIKPKNIVLRGDGFGDPVLIDFGIAFNAENDHLNITSTDEPIGNQFLWLPEQQSDTGNQRDPCSDVTQVVGILFFLVTQQDPVWLLDRSGRMPHRRPEAKKELDKIDPTGREILRRVFDTGFVWPDARRWQSPQALRIAMEQNTLGDPVDLSDLRETILDKRAARNPVYNDQAVFRSARNAILGALYNPILELHRGLVGFEPFGSSAQIDFSTMAFEYRTGLRDMSVPEMGFEVTFVVRATGNEIVIVRKDEEQDTEVSRVPFESNPDFSGLSASLTHFYSRELGKRARST